MTCNSSVFTVRDVRAWSTHRYNTSRCLPPIHHHHNSITITNSNTTRSSTQHYNNNTKKTPKAYNTRLVDMELRKRNEGWWAHQRQTVAQHRQHLHEEWQARHQCTAGLYGHEAEAAAADISRVSSTTTSSSPAARGAKKTTTASFGHGPLGLGELNYRDKCIAILCLVHAAANYTWSRCKGFRCALTPRAEQERQTIIQKKLRGPHHHHHHCSPPSSSSSSSADMAVKANLQLKREVTTEAKSTYTADWMTVRQQVLDVLVQQGRHRAAVQADAVQQGVDDQAELDNLTKPMENYTLSRTMTAISALFIFDVTHSMPQEGWRYLEQHHLCLEHSINELSHSRSSDLADLMYLVGHGQEASPACRFTTHHSSSPRHILDCRDEDCTDDSSSSVEEDSLRGDDACCLEDVDSPSMQTSPSTGNTSGNMNDSVALSSPATVGFVVDRQDTLDLGSDHAWSKPSTPTEGDCDCDAQVEEYAPVRRNRGSVGSNHHHQHHQSSTSLDLKKPHHNTMTKGGQQQHQNYVVQLLQKAFLTRGPSNPYAADVLQHNGMPDQRLTFKDAMDDKILVERQAMLQQRKISKYEVRFNCSAMEGAW